MESIISTFHIDWKIIIAQAINFAIVFAVLYIYALKPLSKLMSERAEKIKKGMDDAKKNEEMLKATNEKYDEVLAKARMEASKISEVARKELEAKKAKMIEEAKNEATGIINSGRKTLEAEKNKMVEEAKGEVAQLVVMAAEKIMNSKKDLNNL